MGMSDFDEDPIPTTDIDNLWELNTVNILA